MSKPATAPTNQKVIDINSLSAEDLSNLQRQLDGDLSFFQESVSELRGVANKFGRCQATVDSIKPEEKDKQALIPLSESVYIKARIPDPDLFLIEIGTGYFVEMNRDKAHDYFKRKFTFVENQLDTVCKKVLPEKQQIRQTVVAALQKKIQEMSVQSGGPS
ncbi:prefoldin subunit domain-containing protein [Ditylenchus destructor]|nr:prefoldin subunit domain-containing protein [Ditylenchus destructor]